MNEWMNGERNKWMSGWVSEWMKEWMNARTIERMNELMKLINTNIDGSDRQTEEKQTDKQWKLGSREYHLLILLLVQCFPHYLLQHIRNKESNLQNKPPTLSNTRFFLSPVWYTTKMYYIFFFIQDSSAAPLDRPRLWWWLFWQRTWPISSYFLGLDSHELQMDLCFYCVRSIHWPLVASRCLFV